VPLQYKDEKSTTYAGPATCSNGDKKKALADFSKASQIDPKYAYPFFGRAVAGMLGHQETAPSEASTAIALAGWKDTAASYASLVTKQP
jgi:Flp pilus assembly protein TadD